MAAQARARRTGAVPFAPVSPAISCPGGSSQTCPSFHDGTTLMTPPAVAPPQYLPAAPTVPGPEGGRGHQAPDQQALAAAVEDSHCHGFGHPGGQSGLLTGQAGKVYSLYTDGTVCSWAAPGSAGEPGGKATFIRALTFTGGLVRVTTALPSKAPRGCYKLLLAGSRWAPGRAPGLTLPRMPSPCHAAGSHQGAPC